MSIATRAAAVAVLLTCSQFVRAVPAIDPNLKPSKPSKAQISYVDTSLESYDRFVPMVDGAPFFYNGVQIRVDKTEDVWGLDDTDNKKLFTLAAEDGFTVVNSQVRWMDIQPDISFNATQSAYIQGGSNNETNFADEPSVRVGYSSQSEDDLKLSYFKFDFSDYQHPHDEITAAKLRIYVNADSIDKRSFVGNLYGITNNTWDPATITWANAPSHDGVDISGEEGEDYFIASSSPSWDRIKAAFYYDFDCSDFIINHVNGRVASFILQATGDTNVTVGATIDGAGEDKPPQLVLSNKNEFDWGFLDKMLEWCTALGLKFEIVWFGSDSTDVSMDNRVPYFALNRTKLERLTDDGDGEGHVVVFSKNTDPAYGTYWFILDKNDLTLRKLEKNAIKAMLNHVADWEEANGHPRTLIGVDVANENEVFAMHGSSFEPWHNPATFGAFDDFDSEQDFVSRTMWEWAVNLANGVKESEYPVWTRQNDVNRASSRYSVPYNEARRQDEGTSLDFIGIDLYTRSLPSAFAVGHAPAGPYAITYATGQNLPMIMENSGAAENAASLALATLAGGGLYNTYDLYSSDDFGLYVPGEDYKDPIARGDYVETVRKTNAMLNKVAADIATKKSTGSGGESLAYLNVYLDGKNTTASFGDVALDYAPSNNSAGVGIVIARGPRELAVLSTAAASFNLTGLDAYGVRSLQAGAYKHGRWSSDERVAYETDSGSTLFDIDAYACIRLVTRKNVL
ncbi:hypothetical protein BJY01DRAFT_242845 [Aspergillus pseudoustus]|uniref:Carbohydrate-binding module family 96 domain-containing protein n=1 Tax=Aspergillus pseudoustus TaxID=1810923 RepID=A0ABR4KW60_9EURO